eukprot:gene19097-19456_t
MGTMNNYSELAVSSINLPVAMNDGRSAAFANRWLAGKLCKEFGGCTVTEGRGMWVSDDGELFDEAVNVYQVAHRSTAGAAAYLKALAMEAGRMAEQMAVYFIIAGKANVITVPQIATEAAALAA